MAGSIFVVRKGPHGIVATHPDRVELPGLVAPITQDALPDAFNTLRQPLVAIGCMRLFQGGFEFDSSFILPTAEQSFVDFAELMLFYQGKDLKKRFPPCSVFGHADPTGTPEYNKTLSSRRARAVYAVLIKDPAIWHDLYDHPLGADDWHFKSVQQCLSVPLKTKPAIEPPFYIGEIDGGKTPKTRKDTFDAIEAWTTDRFGKGSRSLSTEQRKALFLEYMNAICHTKAGDDFKLKADRDFLARAADKKLRGDIQGCSEFNPLLLLSQDEIDAANKSKAEADNRNDLYASDRRVLIYIFRHGTKVDPKTWPCPDHTDKPKACEVRFWSDHKDRLKPAKSDDRTFGDNMRILSIDGGGVIAVEPVVNTGNTMACRFYHGLAVRSPCEIKMKEWVIRFLVDKVDDKDQRKKLLFLTNRRYVVHLGETEDAAVIRGTLGSKGEIRIPVLDEETRILIKLDSYAPPETPDDPDAPAPAQPRPTGSEQADDAGFDSDRFPDEDFFESYMVTAGALKAFGASDPQDDLNVRQRLFNLGFGETDPLTWTKDDLDAALKAFRARRNTPKDDDETTLQHVQDDYEISDPPEALEAPPPKQKTAASPSGGGDGAA